MGDITARWQQTQAQQQGSTPMADALSQMGMLLGQIQGMMPAMSSADAAQAMTPQMMETLRGMYV